MAALAIASPASAQTMYRGLDLGPTIYSDKPCLNGDEVRQISRNGNPTAAYLARSRMNDRPDEQRDRTHPPPDCAVASPFIRCGACHSARPAPFIRRRADAA